MITPMLTNKNVTACCDCGIKGWSWRSTNSTFPQSCWIVYPQPENEWLTICTSTSHPTLAS